MNIYTGINGILEADLLGYNTGRLENWETISEDWKTTGLNEKYHRKKRGQEYTEQIEMVWDLNE